MSKFHPQNFISKNQKKTMMTSFFLVLISKPQSKAVSVFVSKKFFGSGLDLRRVDLRRVDLRRVDLDYSPVI